MSELRNIRLCDRGISQFELSRLSGIHPSRISRLEAGLIEPSMKEIQRISEALGVVPEEVFGLGTVMKKLNGYQP